MKLKKQLSHRFRAEFLGEIIYVSSGAVLIVALARLLDPEGYGLMFLALSVIGVVKIFSQLGISSSASRYVANYKETNSGQIPHILRFSFLLNLIILLVVCIVFLLLHSHLAALIGEPDLIPFLLIGVFYIIFSTSISFTQDILQGFEAIKASAVLTGIRGAIRPILAIGFVLLGFGALGAFVGYILAYAIGGIIGLIYTYNQYYRGKEQTQREKGIRRRIIEYSVPITATSTAKVLDNHIDVLLIGFFLNPTAVAFYTVSKRVIGFVEAPMSALGFTLSPTFEAQKAKGNEDTAARIYEKALSHGLSLYIPASAGLILISEPFVILVFGEEYIGATPVLQILAIYAVLVSIVKVTGNGLDFLGRARARAIARGITATLNVGLNIVLIPTIGVIGAAIATVVTYSIYTFANVYIMALELDLQINWLIKQIIHVCLITLAMSLIVYALSDLISGFITLFMVVGIGISVWAILVLSTGLLDVRETVSTLVR
ncbi:flippase [Natronococcus roseus]|uniref:flippase n=1 Tax=Natronococcus roseus TaxID=1052014 RepID=UPI00374CFFF3